MVFNAGLRACPNCSTRIPMGESVCLRCGRQARANPLARGKGLVMLVVTVVAIIAIGGTVVGLGASKGQSSSAHCAATLDNMVVATTNYDVKYPNGTNTPYYAAYAKDEALINWVTNESGIYALTPNTTPLGLAQALEHLNNLAVTECVILQKDGVNIASITSN